MATALKVDTTLVETTVVVRDGKGRAVPGLQRGDGGRRDRDHAHLVAIALARGEIALLRVRGKPEVRTERGGGDEQQEEEEARHADISQLGR